jgi:hypothetical protein
MTLPNEEVNALRRTRDWLRELATSKRMSQSEIKRKCWGVLKHFPPDHRIEKLYQDEVCFECGQDNRFCMCRK